MGTIASQVAHSSYYEKVFQEGLPDYQKVVCPLQAAPLQQESEQYNAGGALLRWPKQDTAMDLYPVTDLADPLCFLSSIQPACWDYTCKIRMNEIQKDCCSGCHRNSANLQELAADCSLQLMPIDPGYVLLTGMCQCLVVGRVLAQLAAMTRPM